MRDRRLAYQIGLRNFAGGQSAEQPQRESDSRFGRQHGVTCDENQPQQIVSDGKTILIYTPQLNQVNTGKAPEALSGPAGSFLSGLGKLREHFNVRLLTPAQPKDADGNVVLDLTPKQPLPTLTRLILSFDPNGWQLRKAVVYDQFENTVTMQFTKLAINSGLEDKLFAFVPPKGVATVPLK